MCHLARRIIVDLRTGFDTRAARHQAFVKVHVLLTGLIAQLLQLMTQLLDLPAQLLNLALILLDLVVQHQTAARLFTYFGLIKKTAATDPGGPVFNNRALLCFNKAHYGQREHQGSRAAQPFQTVSHVLLHRRGIVPVGSVSKDHATILRVRLFIGAAHLRTLLAVADHFELRR